MSFSTLQQARSCVLKLFCLSLRTISNLHSTQGFQVVANGANTGNCMVHMPACPRFPGRKNFEPCQARGVLPHHDHDACPQAPPRPLNTINPATRVPSRRTVQSVLAFNCLLFLTVLTVVLKFRLTAPPSLRPYSFSRHPIACPSDIPLPAKRLT